MRPEPPEHNQEKLNPTLNLWNCVFGDGRGLLQIFTGKRTNGNRLEETSYQNFNYPVAAESAARWAMDKSAEGREVYFCAHLLVGPRRIKDNAAETNALWADLDGAEVPNGKLTPSCVVESSPGRHQCYWRLSDPMPPKDAEQLNQRLTLAIGADPSGFDLTQLLRVPGTINQKYENKPVVTLDHRLASICHPPRDLDEILPRIEGLKAEREPKDTEGEPPVELSPEDLKVWRGEKPKTKDTGELDRSASLMKIGRALYDAGANRRVVVEALKERDAALDWHCYTDRRDDREYARIFTKLEEAGRNPKFSASNASNASGQQDLSELPTPEPFPLEALPPTTRFFVRETTTEIDCSLDYVGVSVLAALSTAIGDTRRIVIKKRWSEGASLYATMVGPPGSKKTPAMDAALMPVYDRQRIYKKEYERQKEEYKQRLKEQKDVKNGGAVTYDSPEKPILKRTWVDDTTVERLADILGENPRGVVVAKDELSAWLRSMDQYKQGGKGSDRQFWLKAHTNKPTAVDRKSLEEPVIISRPWVSIIGGIQPGVLPDFGKDREDGLLERFIFAYPEPYIGSWTDDEVSDEAQRGYEATITALCRLEYAEDANGDPFPSKLRMSDEAKETFTAQYNSLREEQQDQGFPQRLAPAWSKLDGLLARLALILAVTRVAEIKNKGGGLIEECVTEEDMSGAVRLLEYFKNHTERVYAGLYGQQRPERLAADLRSFLVDHGGVWEGAASELHRDLDVSYKPERPEDLAKMVRGVVQRSPSMTIEDLPRVNSRRPFRLTLLAAGTAGTAGAPGGTSG